MGKCISLGDMAEWHCMALEKVEELASNGCIPSHRHSITGEIIFTDSDMFCIDRQKLLTGLPLVPGRFDC